MSTQGPNDCSLFLWLHAHCFWPFSTRSQEKEKRKKRKYFRKSRFDGNSRPSAHFKFLFLSGEVLFETKKVTRARWIDVNSAGAIFACDTSRSKHLCMSEQFEHGAFKKGGFFLYCWGSFFSQARFSYLFVLIDAGHPLQTRRSLTLNNMWVQYINNNQSFMGAKFPFS